MKLAVVLIVIGCLQVSAKGFSQIISLSEKNSTLNSLFESIKKQSGYTFFYNNKLIKQEGRISIELKNVSIQAALDQIFKNRPFSYRIMNNTVVIKKELSSLTGIAINSVAQINIKGKILDRDGNPLSGASVVIKGTSRGTSASTTGDFSIEAKEGDILVVKYLGYMTKEITIQAGTTTLNIVLEAEMQDLSEVVVTALGIKREEKSLGYAVQKIGGEKLQTVKGVDIGTSLTGRIAGLQILNSTEFYDSPSITLRGESPLVVIDGVPYGNLNLRDVGVDNIETIDVLKGATASALYGSRGGNGAIIITTKRGLKNKGLDVEINTSNMFTSGFLRLPEVQHSYSAGYGGKYNTDDEVWGDKLDIGRRAMQWDPVLKKITDQELTSKGKNNFNDFLETSFITNNSVSITQQGESGSFRVSLSDIYNKGQYPNTKLNMTTFAVGGNLKSGDKFTMDANLSYNRRTSPNIWGKGYGNQGYIYNILVWTGPEYDLSQFKDYWVTPNEEQNWHYNNWYDNPYLMAYEKLNGVNINKLNISIAPQYKINSWAKILLRSGFDYYGNKETKRNPINVNATRGWDARGLYMVNTDDGFSTNNDLILMTDNKLGDFRFEALAGGSIYYYEDHELDASTRNGISVPGFYSLSASVEPATTAERLRRKQVNSLYGKATISYKNAIYLDVTGRNDWSSVLSKETGSYFYPSFAGSAVMSELIKMPEAIDFWKLRGSWAVTKKDVDVYELNQTYALSNGVWDGLTSARYPTSLRDAGLLARSERTYEFGTAATFLKNRLNLDVTYYNKFYYNTQAYGPISSASGFNSKLVNTQETIIRRGFEVTLGGTPIKKDNFKWDVVANWSRGQRFYKDLDPTFTADKPWIKSGERVDAYVFNDWERDPSGNVIYYNGFPRRSNFESKVGYADPNWIWGIANTFTYKSFNLSVAVDGRVGGQSFSGTNARLLQTGAHPSLDNEYRYNEVVNGQNTFIANGSKVVSGTVTYDKYGNITSDNRVFAKNDRVVSYETFIKSTYSNIDNIWDESFFKVREISLGYSLPSQLVSKVGAKSASLNLVGQNVLLWTKEYKYTDPDIASDDLNSPSIRYLGFNLKVSF